MRVDALQLKAHVPSGDVIAALAGTAAAAVAAHSATLVTSE